MWTCTGTRYNSNVKDPTEYSSKRREKLRGAIKPGSGELCESFIANHREQRTHVVNLLVTTTTEMYRVLLDSMHNFCFNLFTRGYMYVFSNL